MRELLLVCVNQLIQKFHIAINEEINFMICWFPSTRIVYKNEKFAFP